MGIFPLLTCTIFILTLLHTLHRRRTLPARDQIPHPEKEKTSHRLRGTKRFQRPAKSRRHTIHQIPLPGRTHPEILRHDPAELRLHLQQEHQPHLPKDHGSRGRPQPDTPGLHPGRPPGNAGQRIRLPERSPHSLQPQIKIVCANWGTAHQRRPLGPGCLTLSQPVILCKTSGLFE